ncbi:MAG: DUF4276 family protein [SAR324 cluster bacterium]|nr:DUF4276 family protein [SAR324 cluster bacterium]
MSNKVKKLAVFVEGLTEQLFINELLLQVIDGKNINIDLIKAREKNGSGAKFIEIKASSANPIKKYYALVVDCGNDDKVKTDILDRYENLVKCGYETVIGIRDVYPTPRSKIKKLELGLRTGMKTKPLAVSIFLAVMEVEAWFIGECTHFERVDRRLTMPFIKAGVGFDPSRINPEEREHPAGDLHNIYQLVALSYIRKRRKQLERTVDNLDFANIYLDVRHRVNSLGALMDAFDNFFHPA